MHSTQAKLNPKTLDQPSGLSVIDLNYLIPGLPPPCIIYFYYKGKFIEGLTPEQALGLSTFEKVRSELYFIGFILKEDETKWEEWVRSRHEQNEKIELLEPSHVPSPAHYLFDPGAKKKSKVKERIHEFIQHGMSKIIYHANNEIQEAQTARAGELFKAAAQNKMIEWYFSLPLEEAVFHHDARVTYIALLFASNFIQDFAYGTSGGIENLAISTIIHELEGDPAKAAVRSTPETTLELISKSKFPIPDSVKTIIEQQDELYSGKGMPRRLVGEAISLESRIFNLANVFDHNRLIHSGGTRRVRTERAQKLMEQRQEDFDPNLSEMYWKFVKDLEMLE